MVAFRKMQGLGNDFVVLDARAEPIALRAETARRLADRHFGIGCDTVVLIGEGGNGADASLSFFNADGSEADSCGNATRCIARLLMDEGYKTQVTIASRGGLLTCDDAGDDLVTVDMGMPRLDWRAVPLAREEATEGFTIALDGRTIAAAAVSMGNPHCVLFVADAQAAPVAALGPRLECHDLFPQKTNVEFAQILDAGRIRMRVWERGVGITLACGTGACATLVAAARQGLIGRNAEVILDGGSLMLEWRTSDDHVLMTGAAATSFTGEIDLDRP